jgi:hypothetical protein
MPELINNHVHLTHTMATVGITGFEMMTWEEISAIWADVTHWGMRIHLEDHHAAVNQI